MNRRAFLGIIPAAFAAKPKPTAQFAFIATKDGLWRFDGTAFSLLGLDKPENLRTYMSLMALMPRRWPA